MGCGLLDGTGIEHDHRDIPLLQGVGGAEPDHAAADDDNWFHEG
jgi:hypothetical protein